MRQVLLSFIALFAATLILTSGIGLLGTFLSLRMTLEGFPSQLIGLVMACYYLGLILGGFICQPVIRRVGHIRAFAVFAAVNTTSVLLQALYIGPWAWLGLRILTGVAMIGLYMTVESWLNERAEPRQRGRVLSIYMAASFLGLGSGQFLLNLSPVEGGNLFLIVAMLLVLSLIPVALTRTPRPQLPNARGFSLNRLAHLAPFGLLGCIGAGIATGTFFALAPSFALQVGQDTNSIALFMGVTIFSGLLLQWPVGWLSDHYDRRTLLALINLVLALACGGVALSIEYMPALLLPASALYGGVAFPLYSVAAAHTNDHVIASDIVGVSSILLLLYGVGAFLGPIIAAQVMVLAGPAGLYVFVGLSALIFGGITFARRRAEPVMVADQIQSIPVPRTSPVIYVLDPRAAEPVAQSQVTDLPGKEETASMEQPAVSGAQQRQKDSAPP